MKVVILYPMLAVIMTNRILFSNCGWVEVVFKKGWVEVVFKKPNKGFPYIPIKSEIDEMNYIEGNTLQMH